MTVTVTTCVSENYQHYIPLWTYCLNRAYPEYKVKVFLTDRATPKLREGVEGLNVELVEKEFSSKRYEAHPPRFAAWCRYLLFTKDRYHHWQDTNWVYITDADLMVVKQEPPLHKQHIEHMKALNLCYSNMLRDPLRFADKHLTGLHFCGQDFIHRVMDKCTEYDGLFRIQGGGVLDGKPVIYDERLLYQIVRDSGLDMPPFWVDDDLEAEKPTSYKRRAFRPWHGINIGSAVIPNFEANFGRKGLGWFAEVVGQFVALADDPLFWRVYGMLGIHARWALNDIIRIMGHKLREL